ncbi:MAG: DUF3488 domain-containing protein [Acidobacteria bacterium]|nr:DUF3488 domain-containing protein [Acidobacteriota bacterium]
MPNLPALHGQESLAAARRYFEVSLFLLIATSLTTVVSTGKLDPFSTVLPLAALLIKGVRFFRGHGPELSHRTATILTVLYFVFFPFDLLVVSRALAEGAPNPILYGALLAAVHLMLFAVVVRLFSASTTRDHIFLAALAFAMMLIAAILTVDTMFLAFFLVFLVLAVSTFVGLEMRRSSEGAVAPPLAAGTPQAKRLQRALTFTSIFVAVSALLVGTVVFYILPRVTAGFLSGYNLSSSLLSGFSENDELGLIGEIKRNAAVVMRVRVDGGPARMKGVRWRGVVRTNFDGHSWTTVAPERQINQSQFVSADRKEWYFLWYDDHSAPKFNSQEYYGREKYRRNLDYQVLLEPLGTDAVFLVPEALRVSGRFSPEARSVGARTSGAFLYVDRTRSVFNPTHNLVKTLYEARSEVYDFPDSELRAASTEYPEDIRSTYLQLPENLDPRTQPFAEQITAGYNNPFDKAAAIERYLNTRFGYTLQLPPPNPDPLAHFLFRRQSGHCEYFATAMTIMLRTIGIPARYVKGFQQGEYNDVANSYIVRGNDAHTWVEVYFPKYGWVAFDPTPPSGAEVRTWIGRLTFYYDWFELAWSEWVINYNSGRQLSLMVNAVVTSSRLSGQFRQFIEQKQRAVMLYLRELHLLVQRAMEQSPSSVAAILALFALAVVVLFKGREVREFIASRWGVRIGSDAQLTPRRATLLYQQMLRLLARRGWQKAAGQTAMEFAAAIPAPEFTAPVMQFTELYQSARFGVHPADAQRMNSLLETIQSQIRGK